MFVQKLLFGKLVLACEDEILGKTEDSRDQQRSERNLN